MKSGIWSGIATDTRNYFREWRVGLKKYRWPILLFAVGVAAAALFLVRFDRSISNWFVEISREPLSDWAIHLRKWGDFRDTVTVTALIFISGCIFKRRNWRRLAVAFFLSASLAGIGVNILRFTTGRPRPYVKNVEDRWYGPVMVYPKKWIPGGAKIFAFQSFPSGHSGTSVGAATMLVIAAPPIGILMAISAGGVVWSSLYANKHYLTDVVCGTAIGLVFGTLGGLACRRMRPSAPEDS